MEKNREHCDAGAGRRQFLTAMAAGILGAGSVRIGQGTSAVSAWTGLETNSILNQARPLDSADALKIVKVEPLILRLKNPGGDPLSRNPSAAWNLLRKAADIPGQVSQTPRSSVISLNAK